MPLGGIWIGLRCIEGKTVVLEVGGKEVLWTYKLAAVWTVDALE